MAFNWFKRDRRRARVAARAKARRLRPTVPMAAANGCWQGLEALEQRVLLSTAPFFEIEKLVANEAAAQDQFGGSVAVSADGQTVVVGAPGDDVGGDSGSATVYQWDRVTGRFGERKLTASDAAPFDEFGHSVAVSADGQTVVVGVSGDDDGGDESGSAYIYRWDLVSGSFVEHKLTASDAAEFDKFGSSVSVSRDGQTVVVGASGDDDGGDESGSAYVYQWNLVTGSFVQQKLTASDAAAGDEFGSSVSVSGDGQTFVVGAPGDDDSGDESGSAYVYRWNAVTGRFGPLNVRQKLTASDAARGDQFGSSVAVSADGQTVVVGTPGDDDGGDHSGSAYVYQWDEVSFAARPKLTTRDGEANDRFGSSVSVSADGQTVVVGALGDDDGGDNSGSAYVYRWKVVSSRFVQQKLTAMDAAAGDEFGSSVAVSADGQTFVVGAPGDDDGGDHSGSAYVSDIPLVSLGNVQHPTEGFGFGTTIEGLGAAIDTTMPLRIIEGNFGKPLGIRESGKFTMEAWLYPKPGVAEGVVWNYIGGYQLYRVNDTGLRMALSRSGRVIPGITFDVTVDKVLTADAWNHVAMTFDGDQLQLLVNGVVVASEFDTTPDFEDIQLVEPTRVNFKTGARLSDPSGGAGAIDEVRVWTTARTQTEIQEAMLTQLSGTEQGLVAYWNFDNSGIENRTELDSSPTGNTLDTSIDIRFENPAPQIGYVDVILDREVDSPLGLWVTYTVTGGTAQDGVDVIGSRFRKVSSDPSTERNGIIIPRGQKTGRIYFVVLPDAIFEPAETFDVQLTGFSFDGTPSDSDYRIGVGKATVSIADSGAFTPGVAGTDATGRPVTVDSPLFVAVDPVTGRGAAEFFVTLTSQPQSTEVINVTLDSNFTLTPTSLMFDSSNWDRPQRVNLSGVSAGGTIQVRATGYIDNDLAFAFTTIPPQEAQVEEGNPADLAPVTPTVSLLTVADVTEGDNQSPARVAFLLNNPAPAGGLEIAYTIGAAASGSSATPGTDFDSLSGILRVQPGLTRAELPVFVRNDEIDEGDFESLVITLVAPGQAYLVDAKNSQAIVKINDDDQARLVVVNPVVSKIVNEDGTTTSVTTFSSTYAPLVTNEPKNPPLIRLLPGGEPAGGYDLGTVPEGLRVTGETVSRATNFDSEDIYKFTLNAETRVRPEQVTVVFSHAAGDIDAELRYLDAAVTPGSTSGVFVRRTSITDDETLELGDLPDGNYSLRVHLYTATPEQAYSLQFGPRIFSPPIRGQVALRLDSQPTADVTLNFKLSDAGLDEGRLLTTTLSFTPENWDRHQIMEMLPLDDAMRDVDVTYNITATASSSDERYHDRTLAFDVINLDRFETSEPVKTFTEDPALPKARLVVPVSSLNENGSIVNVQVHLSQPASADMTVRISFDESTAVLGEDFVIESGVTEVVDSLQQSALVVRIPKGLESSPFVTLRMLDDKIDERRIDVNDADGDGDTGEFIDSETIDIRLLAGNDLPQDDGTPQGNRYILDANTAGAGTPPNFFGSITVIDDDTAGLLATPITPGNLDVTESGSAGTVALRLATQPTANVLVHVASDDLTEGVVETGVPEPGNHPLVFTSDNWNIDQFVKVVGVDDAVDDGDVSFGVHATASSDDLPYRHLTGPALNFLNLDNDTVGITVSSPQATVDGRTNVFSVVLTTQPVGEVRVTMSPDNDQVEVNDARAGDPATIIFDADNWDVPQLVQVVAVDDSVVEFFHQGQIRFAVETGLSLRGATAVDIGTPLQAFDLDEIQGGLRWKDIPVPLSDFYDPDATEAYWYRLSLPDAGKASDQIRVIPAGDNTTDIPSLTLYRALDTATPLRNGVRTPAEMSDPNFPSVITAPAFETVSLDGLPAVEYLLKVSNDSLPPSTLFTLLIDDEDRVFEGLVIDPISVSIKDNDLPSALITAGPTASEVFSEPSYFAVLLNTPAPAEAGDTGIRVNFQVTGGRATLGNNNSQLHDYTVVADHFDVATKTGWVRVAPGDVQANILIQPVDDKLVEDLPLTVREMNFAALFGQPLAEFGLRVAAALEVTDTAPLLTAGTVLKIQLPDGVEVEAVVKRDTKLNRGVFGTPEGGLVEEYAAGVPVDITDADFTRAFAFRSVNSRAKVESEDVTITLLSGSDYDLPLAPDKQGLPRNPQNLDTNRIVANLNIYDDDVAGIRIVEMGQHTTVAEGDTATFQVSLTAEPRQNVTVALTPGGQIEIVDPILSGTGSFQVTSYQLNDSQAPSNVDIRFDSLHETDQGFTAVFDVRLNSVVLGDQARLAALTLRDANGSGSGNVHFEVPGKNDVDFAGQPIEGDWNQIQRLVVTNLTQNGEGSFTLTLVLDGVSHMLTITPNMEQLSRNTTTLTFVPEKWFELQTVTITGINDAFAEPGEWHKDRISYKVSSTEPSWDKLLVPDQEIHVLDVVLETGQTADAISAGINVLQDSLLALEIPLIGSVANLPLSQAISGDQGVPLVASMATLPLSQAASGEQRVPLTASVATADPQISGFFEEFRRSVKKGITAQKENSVTKIKAVVESALQPLVDRGVIDRVKVTPKANADEVNVIIELDKVFHLAAIDLSADLGVPALGLTTTGKAKADLAFSLDFAFGLHKEFGFYLDTDATGLQVGARVFLEGFTGQGSLGFQRVDFQDDPLNRTELDLTFEVKLSDLDNINTVQFFDINGNGLLDENSFNFEVGVDTDPKDGRIDLDANGQPKTASKTVKEPWTNVSGKGVADPFPRIPDIANDVNMKEAVQANWNTIKAKTNTFDEAELTAKEGIYRTINQGDKKVYYFDANRNGKLDIAARNVDPFAESWVNFRARTSQSAHEKSEIWIRSDDPGFSKWVDVNGNVKEFRFTSTGSGDNILYWFDANGNGINDGLPTELISNSLRKKLDKNKNNILEADIRKDGEGKFTQGTSISFFDTDGDKKLDFDEPFVSHGFAAFQLSTDVFSSTVGGVKCLDFNRNGELDNKDNQIFPPTEFILRTHENTIYLDVDQQNDRDEKEPQAGKSRDTLFMEQKHIEDPIGSPNQIVNFDGNTYNVLTIGGKRFIDLDGNGVLTLDQKGREMEPHADQSIELVKEDKERLAEAIRSAVVGNNTQAGDIERLIQEGKIVQRFNDGPRLTFAELKVFNNQAKQNNATKTDQTKGSLDLFTYSFKGDANLGLKVKSSIDGNVAFPSVQLDLAMNYPLFNYGNAAAADDHGFTVELRNVALDVGTFLGKFVTPILSTANDLIKPIKPVIQALNADTKLLSKIGLAGEFESDGRPGISLLEVAKKLNGGDPRVDTAIKFANHITKLVETIDLLTGSLTTDSNLLLFGNFTLTDLRAASNDEANSTSKSRDRTRANGSAPTTAQTPAPADTDNQVSRMPQGLQNKYNKLKQLEGFKIDLFTPSAVLSLLTGEPNVDLVTYDIPDIDFDFKVDRSFNIWGPIAGKLAGGFNVKTDLSMGFDTHGWELWQKQGFAPDKSYLVFDGLFLDDWTAGGSGADKDELTVRAFVEAGLGLDVVVASGFVKGGVEGIVGLDFVDVGERAGTSDGKIRGSDVVASISNPLNLFDLHGTVNAFLGAEINIDFFFFSETVWERRLATFELAKFQLDASGFSGSALNGTVQTGPVAGATVWFDANNNGLLDLNEPVGVTDSDGGYEINIPDTLDREAGVVRVQGGTDASTGLPLLTSLTAELGEQDNVTAFTTLARYAQQEPVDVSRIDFNEDGVVDGLDRVFFVNASAQGADVADLNADGLVDAQDQSEFQRLFGIATGDGTMTLEQTEALVLESFGLDPSLDIGSFAHFDEALVNNPQASDLLVAINSLNTVVVQLRAFLAGATGAAFDDPPLNGLFTESAYGALARQLVTGKLDLTDEDQLQAIIVEAAGIADQKLLAAGATERIDPETMEANVSFVATILAASTVKNQLLAASAQGGMQLAQVVTQTKAVTHGAVAMDLYRLGKEELDGATAVVRHGRTDEAALEEVRSVALPPRQGAIEDVVILEDQTLSNHPFTVFDFDSPVDQLIFAANSDLPDLLPADQITITPGAEPDERLLSLTPAANRSGIATVTVTVADEQGQTMQQDFTVTVRPVNDAPTFTPGADQYVNQKDGQIVTPWATDISAGAPDEVDQVLEFTVNVDADRSLFTELPSIDPTTGLLTYTPNPDASGVATVTVSLADSGGISFGGRNVSAPMVFTIAVAGISVQDGELRIVGTDQDDHVTINRQGNGQFKVHGDFLPDQGEQRTVAASGIDWIHVILLGGDDRLTVAGSIDTRALIEGGEGDDHLNGGGGHNIVLGQAGADKLIGGSGRDILIGGLGQDRLVANAGQDILIGGWTAFDASFAKGQLGNKRALLAMLDEWTSLDRDFEARRANLSVSTLDLPEKTIDDRFNQRLNENHFLVLEETVFDDLANDTLTGSAGQDWALLFDIDRLTGGGPDNGRQRGRRK